MTTDSLRPAATRFILAVTLLAVLAMAVTVAVGYLVTDPPRTMLVWWTIGFLCTIQFIAALLAINVFARAQSAYRPSGAVMGGMWRILALYLVLGVALLAGYALVRDAEGERDLLFAGAFAALTTVLFVIATTAYAFDLLSEARERPIQETRRTHAAAARSLTPVLAALRSASIEDPAVLDVRLKLVKRIEALDTALRHSHGGGTGSWEHGKLAQDPEAFEQVEASIAALSADADGLGQAREPDAIRALLERMGAQAGRAEGAIRKLELA